MRVWVIVLIALMAGGCAISQVEEWVEEVYINVVLSRVLGLLVSLVGQLTSLLAHTPTDLFNSEGFHYVYARTSFLALTFIAVIWVIAGLKVFWGTGTKSDFQGVVTRTAMTLIIVKLLPVAIGAAAALANRLAQTFSRDYQAGDVGVLLEGSSVRDAELGIILFSVIVVYYLMRILLQYAWRVGALVLAHIFAPVFSVLWILPSQHNLLAQVAKSILSLLVIQVAHTLELWAFTWITFGVGSEGSLWTRVLLQVGFLQVMVSTPGYVVSNLSQWISQPRRMGTEAWQLLSLHPIRASISKLKGVFSNGKRLVE